MSELSHEGMPPHIIPIGEGSGIWHNVAMMHQYMTGATHDQFRLSYDMTLPKFDYVKEAETAEAVVVDYSYNAIFGDRHAFCVRHPGKHKPIDFENGYTVYDLAISPEEKISTLTVVRFLGKLSIVKKLHSPLQFMNRKEEDQLETAIKNDWQVGLRPSPQEVDIFKRIFITFMQKLTEEQEPIAHG